MTFPARTLRSLLALGFAASSALVLACSGDEPASEGDSADGGSSSRLPSGATSAEVAKQCKPATTSCTEAQLADYATCATSRCDNEYEQCFGNDYDKGTFGGACGSHTSCVAKCDCADVACVEKCGKPASECTACQERLSTCISSKCTTPACLGGGGGSQTGSTTDAGSQTGSSGGSSSSRTCGDLQACCGRIQNSSRKQACTSAYDSVRSRGDAACSAAYSTFAGDC